MLCIPPLFLTLNPKNSSINRVLGDSLVTMLVSGRNGHLVLVRQLPVCVM